MEWLFGAPFACAQCSRGPKIVVRPRQIIHELSNLNARQGERRILARELPLVLPNAPSFDTEGFIASQLAVLNALETS